MNFSNVENLLGTLLVCEDADKLSLVDMQDAYALLKQVKLELTDYIKQLVSSTEPYIVDLKMPLDSVHTINLDNINPDLIILHLPFGTISLNVWQKLKENLDNPVFKVLRYFSDNVKCIRDILTMYGVADSVPLTRELLEEYKIFDLYGLHEYENAYKDFDKYLDADTYIEEAF